MSWVLIDNTHLFEPETDAWFDVLGAVTRRQYRPLGGGAGSAQVDSGGKTTKHFSLVCLPRLDCLALFPTSPYVFFSMRGIWVVCWKSTVALSTELICSQITHAHITHINILKCTLEPPKLSDILLNILKVEEYSTSWCFYTHPSFLYGVRSLCRSIQQTSLSDYKCQCWKSFLPQLWRAQELSVSNVCINFHLAQPTPFDYREGTGMQNEYYTHPLDCTFGFQINVTVSAQISSCTCHVKLEMYCSLSDPWICIDTHT